MNDSKMPRGVKWIQLAEHKDDRGCLVAATAGEEIPFKVERVFWISQIPIDQKRGAHAHWWCEEAVFAASGSFDIEVDDGETCVVLTLNSGDRGVTIPAGVWCELRNFSADVLCVVMASQAYSEEGYVYDRNKWRKALCK